MIRVNSRRRHLLGTLGQIWHHISSQQGHRVIDNASKQEGEIKPTPIWKFKRPPTIRIISKYFKDAGYKMNNKIQCILRFVSKEGENKFFECSHLVVVLSATVCENLCDC